MICYANSYLLVNLICIQCFPVGVSAGVKSAHKFIVVNKTVAVQVKDVCHCIHLQGVCGKFYKEQRKFKGVLT